MLPSIFLALPSDLLCLLLLHFSLLIEINYDQFHKDGDRIYRVSKSYFNGDKIVETVPFRSYLLDRMREGITAIESTTTIRPLNDSQVVSNEKTTHTERKLAFADTNFFDFFSFQLLEGHEQSALKSPYTVVISERKALEYFQEESAIGEVITIEGSFDRIGFDAKITGVFRDIPQNSHFQYDFLISMATGEIEK